jgi:ABC-type polysaccharide/polyol phosphate export permease
MQEALKVLRPIYQPFNADIFCTGKKFLVFNLVTRNLKVKYHRSILGIFWTLLTPLAMTAVYYFVFKIVLQIQIPHHLVFILSGMLVWNFIGQTLMEGMESIAGNLGLLTKVPIPIQVFPFVGALTNLVTLILAFPILLGTALLSHVPLSSSFLLFSVYMVMIFLMTYSFSLILAILFVQLRDLRHVIGIFLQIWFYATPVIYDERMIPEKYSWVLYLNPYGFAFSDIHTMWIQGGWPSLSHFYITLGWTAIAVLSAAALHSTLSKGLVERI